MNHIPPVPGVARCRAYPPATLSHAFGVNSPANKKGGLAAAFLLPGGANSRFSTLVNERANLSAQSLLRQEAIDKLSTNSHRLTLQTSWREDRLPRSRHRRGLQQRMTRYGARLNHVPCFIDHHLNGYRS